MLLAFGKEKGNTVRVSHISLALEVQVEKYLHCLPLSGESHNTSLSIKAKKGPEGATKKKGGGKLKWRNSLKRQLECD